MGPFVGPEGPKRRLGPGEVPRASSGGDRTPPTGQTSVGPWGLPHSQAHGVDALWDTWEPGFEPTAV